MPKRNNGDGTISHYEGRTKPWRVQTSARDGRKRQTKYFNTKSEAATWLRQISASQDAGTAVEPSRLTLNAWLDTWLNSYVKPSVRQKTLEGYESIIRCHITNTIGDMPLQSIMPADVQSLLNNRAEAQLSSRTLTYILSTLRPAFKQAINDGLIIRNPADAVKLPKTVKATKAKRALTPEEIQAIYTHAEPRLLIALTLMAQAGLRVGEALGIQWDDIDINKRELHVKRAISQLSTGRVLDKPKTPESVRIIPISHLLFEVLNQWRSQQAEERLISGAMWRDDLRTVCTMPLGNRMRQEWISGKLNSICKELNIKGCTPHVFRHTFASNLMLAGVDIKTAQELMGHASPRMILEVYAHSSEDAKRKAIEKMG